MAIYLILIALFPSIIVMAITSAVGVATHSLATALFVWFVCSIIMLSISSKIELGSGLLFITALAMIVVGIIIIGSPNGEVAKFFVPFFLTGSAQG